MYQLLAALQHKTPLYLISVIDSGDWVWVQLGFPRIPGSAGLRFRKADALTPYSLLLQVDGKEIPIEGASAVEQAEQIWAELEQQQDIEEAHRRSEGPWT